MKNFLYQFLFFSLIFLQGCQAEEQYGTNDWKKDAPFYHGEYVDFESFKKGRLCADVRFTCLAESQDKLVIDTPLENGLDSFELTAEVMEKYFAILKEKAKNYDEYHSKEHPKGEKAPMLISELNKEVIESVKGKRFLKEMEEQLEKEFPGFWRDTPKKVRYRWIQRAMNKAKVFGYDPKQNNAMVELCARIGLNFDKDPKWEAVTKFVSSKEDNIGTACDYVDYTVLSKSHGYGGNKITDWSMRDAQGLPDPKTPYPRLND
jgi:hypothetical protein